MTGPTQPDSRQRRLALFAAASVLLHVALLLLIQFAALDDPAVVRPEPVPVQFVDLQEPPPPPAPDLEPPVPQPPEIPQDQPPEIAPPPPARPAAPPAEIPDRPAPTPDITDEPAPAPEIPAQPPAPAPEPDTQPEAGATIIAPEPGAPDEAEAEAPPASAGIPGLSYNGGRGSDLAWFGHAIECMDLDLRHTEYCADIGAIYVAENVERLAPEVEAEFRAMMARRNRYSGALDRTTGACEPPAGGNLADSACLTDAPRLRDLLNQIQDATD